MLCTEMSTLNSTRGRVPGMDPAHKMPTQPLAGLPPARGDDPSLFGVIFDFGTDSDVGCYAERIQPDGTR